MKYEIGNRVRKGSTSYDTYIVKGTKEDKIKHPNMLDGYDYVIQKEYDVELKKGVKNASIENVMEEQIWM